MPRNVGVAARPRQRFERSVMSNMRQNFGREGLGPPSGRPHGPVRTPGGRSSGGPRGASRGGAAVRALGRGRGARPGASAATGAVALAPGRACGPAVRDRTAGVQTTPAGRSRRPLRAAPLRRTGRPAAAAAAGAVGVRPAPTARHGREPALRSGPTAGRPGVESTPAGGGRRPLRAGLSPRNADRPATAGASRRGTGSPASRRSIAAGRPAGPPRISRMTRPPGEVAPPAANRCGPRQVRRHPRRRPAPLPPRKAAPPAQTAATPAWGSGIPRANRCHSRQGKRHPGANQCHSRPAGVGHLPAARHGAAGGSAHPGPVDDRRAPGRVRAPRADGEDHESIHPMSAAHQPT